MRYVYKKRASTSMELCSGKTRKPFASSCVSPASACARLRSEFVDAVDGQGGKPIADSSRENRGDFPHLNTRSCAFGATLKEPNGHKKHRWITRVHLISLMIME